LPTRGLASRYCRANSRSCMCRLGVCSLVWRPRHETRENLYQFLEGQGYQLCLLHPRQTHQFARASRLARENRSVGCYHYCPGLAQRRGSPWLCANGSDCDKRENESACIRTSPMKSRATKTRSRPGFACSSQNSARFSLIRVGLLP
jgi:hypothetical protein